MASPSPAIAIPPSIKFTSVRLATKPTAALECTQVDAGGDDPAWSDTLLVFINGLVAPQAAWLPVMALVLKRLETRQQQQQPHGSSSLSRPQMLAYDRFGQGKTVDRDPADAEDGKEPGYGHDVMDVVRDLHQLIAQVTSSSSSSSSGDGDGEGGSGSGHHQPQKKENKRLVLVANSIGGAIARLYAHTYPGAVAGVVFLDSMIANTNFVDIFPDPDSPYFDASPSSLPEGVTPALLRETRDRVRPIFHPTVRNREGLDRRYLADQLPHADAPALPPVLTSWKRKTGDDGGGGGRAAVAAPFVFVYGHDAEHFARENLEGVTKTPLVMSRTYLNPVWQRYNEGLARLTEPGRARGPLEVPGTGHFIQRDDPAFVAGVVVEMLDLVVGEGF
ncbi:Alpha/Beta hydrolase protein [Xylariomycetidae sp. FL2044]|nr:Alpha/Beta hydrolase protein [Xylariomycetidae sp. FL2044]